jgi:hypothetical protein
MGEEEKKEIEKQSVLTGFNKVLEIIANKISKKAALLALAMLLIYLLGTYLLSLIVIVEFIHVLIVMGIISGLAVFGVVLQFVIDYLNAETRKKEKKEDTG